MALLKGRAVMRFQHDNTVPLRPASDMLKVAFIEYLIYYAVRVVQM